MQPRLWIVALCVMFVALAVRLVGLGTWSYAGDELASTVEESVLFHNAPASPDSQVFRLPHLVPLGYIPMHISHTIFGEDERGFRIGSAVVGALTVLIVLLFLDVPGWRTVAVLSALSVALWAEHVFRSGECRFYGTAAAFSFAASLAAWRASRQHSPLMLMVAMGCALLAVYCHALLIELAPALALVVFSIRQIRYGRIERDYLIIGFATIVVLAAIVIVHIYPLIRGWNSAESWGYSPSHALMAGVVSVGVMVFALAVAGASSALSTSEWDGIYWSALFILWVGNCALLPIIVPFHVGYIFSLSLPVIVLASQALHKMSGSLSGGRSIAAYCVLSLGIVSNIPTLASHFVDGSRWDERSPAEFVRKVWRTGDSVATYTSGYFRHYSQMCCAPVIALAPGRVSEALSKLRGSTGKVWVILESPRGGLPAETRDWLYRCARQRFGITRRRLDFAEFNTAVFEYAPADGDGCHDNDR